MRTDICTSGIIGRRWAYARDDQPIAHRSTKVSRRSGTGARGATNDIGVAWPPGRKPLLIAVYYVGSTAEIEAREAVIAAAARIIAARD
ncbi:MAG TPA: hypothetical protein VLM79_02220 [Kofleriaceae bacterium]|nr:hypothetical protein [Kofleriaceae bacterium]